MIPLSAIRDAEVRVMANEAQEFLTSHVWCVNVSEAFLAYAIAGVVGVFLFRIMPSRKEVDDTLWVIVGDLPPAYLVCDNAPDWQAALDAYIVEMRRWVQAVREGGEMDDIIPVNVPPTKRYAEMLSGRLDFLKARLVDVPSDTWESDS